MLAHDGRGGCRVHGWALCAVVRPRATDSQAEARPYLAVLKMMAPSGANAVRGGSAADDPGARVRNAAYGHPWECSRSMMRDRFGADTSAAARLV